MSIVAQPLPPVQLQVGEPRQEPTAQAGPPTEARWCWNVPGTMSPGGEEGTGRRGPRWPLFGALFSQHPEEGLAYTTLPRPPPPAQPSPHHRLARRQDPPGKCQHRLAQPTVPAGQGDGAGARVWTQGSWGHGLAAQALRFPGPLLRGLWEDDPAMKCGRDTLEKGKHWEDSALLAPK